MSSLQFDLVSFICPVCRMTCGWNAKKQEFDAIQVEGENPRERQYAHKKCVDAGPEQD